MEQQSGVSELTWKLAQQSYLCNPNTKPWDYCISGIIGELNIWQFTLKMQLARFLIDGFECCMERTPSLQPKWHTFNLVIFT